MDGFRIMNISMHRSQNLDFRQKWAAFGLETEIYRVLSLQRLILKVFTLKVIVLPVHCTFKVK